MELKWQITLLEMPKFLQMSFSCSSFTSDCCEYFMQVQGRSVMPRQNSGRTTTATSNFVHVEPLKTSKSTSNHHPNIFQLSLPPAQLIQHGGPRRVARRQSPPVLTDVRYAKTTPRPFSKQHLPTFLQVRHSHEAISPAPNNYLPSILPREGRLGFKASPASQDHYGHHHATVAHQTG